MNTRWSTKLGQGTPFFFTPFVGGNGNTTVLGGPARGKSLNANALFTGAMKYGGKTFIFDQGGSYESNVRALGGSVTHLGLEYPRLNFFRAANTKENIHAISQIIRLMLNKSGVAVGNDDQDAIEKGVERLFDVPVELRRLKHLTLPPNLRQGLKRWIEGGVYGSIFDNVEDDLQFHDLQLFDFASLGDKHNDLLEVEMSWILLLCQNIIRDKKNLGVPKHIVMDELWKRMGVLPVLSFVLETIKADRKNLAWATLVTQSLEDLGAYASVIKNACPNTIFLGGAFDRELYAKHFRLNAERARRTRVAGRARACHQGGRGAVRRRRQRLLQGTAHEHGPGRVCPGHHETVGTSLAGAPGRGVGRSRGHESTEGNRRGVSRPVGEGKRNEKDCYLDSASERLRVCSRQN